MDQEKIGSFLKQLRREKGLTQEQLAEILNVSGRSVSRWETGNNMPDLSIIVELSEFYQVSIREIIDGERSNKNMDSEEKGVIDNIVAYTGNEKRQKARKLNKYFILGLACIMVVILDRQLGVLSYIFQKHIDAFICGMLLGLGLLFEWMGFYSNNHDIPSKERKRSFVNSVFGKK